MRGRYYYIDIPFTDLWGTKYFSINRQYDQFRQDCASGDLPEVAFVDPPFFGSGVGSRGAASHVDD